MPPRKKAKASTASTPFADAQPPTPQESGGASQALDAAAGVADAWTDDQETQLFKSMMKWKPTGLHKHFRMISIHIDMRSHGFAGDDAPHTRIPGIWRKLHELYDLRALDERENAYAFSEDPDPADPSEATAIPDFELPEEDFGELIWQRRFHGPASLAASSPPAMSLHEDDKSIYQPGLGLLKERPPGSRSQLLESALEATPAPKTAKNTRASRSTTKATRSGRGQSAKNAKAQSAASESADEDEEDEEESSSESAEEDPAPSTRRTNRSAAAAKTRAAPKRTRKR